MKQRQDPLSSTQRLSAASSIDTESESEGDGAGGDKPDIPYEVGPESPNRLKRPSKALHLANKVKAHSSNPETSEPQSHDIKSPQNPTSRPEKRLRHTQERSKIAKLRLPPRSPQAARSARHSLPDPASLTHRPAPNDATDKKGEEDDTVPVHAAWKHFPSTLRELINEAGPKLAQYDKVLGEKQALKAENIALNAELNELKSNIQGLLNGTTKPVERHTLSDSS